MIDDENKGHRARLKNRFIKSNTGDFLEYELIELLLCYSNPRKDMKPAAKRLLRHYGSIASILSANPQELESFLNIGKSATILIKLVKEILATSLKHNIENSKTIFSSWSSVINYLKLSIGSMNVEVFSVLYLDKKNQLLEEKILATGTIDQITIYPREILKNAIYYNASAIILVHNHPSGNAKPSAQDIQVTRLISDVLKTVNIEILDHVIVTTSNYYSFKSHSLI